MTEPGGRGRGRVLHEHAGLDRLGHPRLDLVGGGAENRPQQGQVDVAGEHRAGAQQALAARGQAGHPPRHQPRESGRDGRRWLRPVPAALLVEQPQQLTQEQRVAPAVRGQIVQPLRADLAPGRVPHVRRDVGLGERPQVQHLDRAGAPQVVEEFPAGGIGALVIGLPDADDDGDGHRTQFAGQVAQERQGGRVGPMQVVEDEQEPAARRARRFDQGADRALHGPEPGAADRVERTTGHRLQLEQLGTERQPERRRPGQQSAPRPQLGHALVGHGPPDQRRHPAPAGLDAQVVEQRRLADARLAGDQRQRSLAGTAAVQHGPQHRALAGPPEQPAVHTGILPGSTSAAGSGRSRRPAGPRCAARPPWRAPRCRPRPSPSSAAAPSRTAGRRAR